MMPARAAFRRGAAVLVSYGAVQIMQAVGAFAAGGRIVDRRHWRRGWYGVELLSGAIVTAHLSAITRL